MSVKDNKAYTFVTSHASLISGSVVAIVVGATLSSSNGNFLGFDGSKFLNTSTTFGQNAYSLSELSNNEKGSSSDENREEEQQDDSVDLKNQQESAGLDNASQTVTTNALVQAGNSGEQISVSDTTDSTNGQYVVSGNENSQAVTKENSVTILDADGNELKTISTADLDKNGYVSISSLYLSMPSTRIVTVDENGNTISDQKVDNVKVWRNGKDANGNSILYYQLEGQDVTKVDSLTTVYYFKGWSLSPDGTTIIGTKLNADQIGQQLYPVWEAYTGENAPTASGAMTKNDGESSVLYIPNGTEYCELTDMELKNIETIIIPASVKNITFASYMENEDDNFGNVSEIIVDEKNEYYSTYNGILYNKDQTVCIKVPAKIESIDQWPSTLQTIKDGALSYVSTIEELELPDTITTIGSMAFENSSIENIIINSPAQLSAWALSEYDGIVTINYDSAYPMKEKAAFACDGENGLQIVLPDDEDTFANYLALWGSVIDSYYGENGKALEVLSSSSNLQDLFVYSEQQGTYVYKDSEKAITWIEENGEYMYYHGKIKFIRYIGKNGDSEDRFASGESDFHFIKGTAMIGEGSFDNCTGSNICSFSVTIPSTVEEIGSTAFINSTRLRTLIFDTDTVFTNLQLSSDTILIVKNSQYNTLYSNTVKKIFNYDDVYNVIDGIVYQMLDGKLTLVICPETYVGTVTIQTGTEIISDYAFENVVWLYGFTSSDTLTTIGAHAFDGCTRLYTYTVPSTVTSIGEYAFANSGKASTSTYGTVTWNAQCDIPAHCFDGATQLRTFTSSSYANLNNITSIGEYAFYNCKYLGSKTSSSRYYSPLDRYFASNYLKNLTTIGAHAFDGCTQMYYYGIPASVTSVGEYAFAGTASGSSASGPAYGDILWNAACDIPEGCFKDAKYLRRIWANSYTNWSGIKSIGDYAFSGCTYLGNYADNITYQSILDTRLTSNLKSLEYIGAHAFENCTYMWNVSVPESVTTVGEYAFSGSMSYWSNSYINWNCSANIPAHCFENCLNLIKVDTINTSNWSQITSIGDYAFAGCSHLGTYNNVAQKFLLCDDYTSYLTSLSSIGSHAFDGCNLIYNLTIPSSVTSVGEYAFAGIASVENTSVTPSVNWNSSVSIPSHAFDGATYLKNFTSSNENAGINQVTSIGESAFANCTSLTNVLDENAFTSLLSIGNNALENCPNVKNITIQTSVNAIGEMAFNSSDGLIEQYKEDATNFVSVMIHFLSTLPDTIDIHELAVSYTYQDGDTTIPLIQIIVPDSENDSVYLNYMNSWNGKVSDEMLNAIDTSDGAKNRNATSVESNTSQESSATIEEVETIEESNDEEQQTVMEEDTEQENMTVIETIEVEDEVYQIEIEGSEEEYDY